MVPLNDKTAFSMSINSYHPISQVGLVFAPAVFVGLWFLLTLLKDQRWGNNKLFSIPTRPLYYKKLFGIKGKATKKIVTKLYGTTDCKKKIRMTIFLKCCPERQFANKSSGISICKKSAWNTNFKKNGKK